MLPIDLRRFSTAFRFPPSLHFVFPIIRTEIYFCAHRNFPACARKFFALGKEAIFLPEGDLFSFEGKGTFLPRKKDFPALENFPPSAGRLLSLRKEKHV